MVYEPWPYGEHLAHPLPSIPPATTVSQRARRGDRTLTITSAVPQKRCIPLPSLGFNQTSRSHCRLNSVGAGTLAALTLCLPAGQGRAPGSSSGLSDAQHILYSRHAQNSLGCQCHTSTVPLSLSLLLCLAPSSGRAGLAPRRAYPRARGRGVCCSEACRSTTHVRQQASTRTREERKREGKKKRVRVWKEGGGRGELVRCQPHRRNTFLAAKVFSSST